jgi:hypothetical protein
VVKTDTYVWRDVQLRRLLRSRRLKHAQWRCDQTVEGVVVGQGEGVGKNELHVITNFDQKRQFITSI